MADIALRRIAVEPVRFVERMQSVWPAALSFLAVGAVGAERGGYFPTSWGWTALAFSWVAAIVLLVLPVARLSRWEFLFVGGLALYTVWILASALWAESATLPLRETQRNVVYVVAALAAVLVTRAKFHRALLGGAWAGIALVCLYALATRLVPDRYGRFDSLNDYRLGQPVGYWNGLAILAVLGVLIGLGLAARGQTRLVRGLAGSSTVVFLPTVYFTFSRGAWVALIVGLLAAIAVDPRRLQLITTALALTPTAASAVLLSSHADGLVLRGSTFGKAIEDGHRLAWMLLALVAVAGAVGAILGRLESLPFSQRVRTTYGAGLLLLAVGAVVAVFATYGGPQTIARKGVEGFTGSNPPALASRNPEERLFTLASPARRQHWQVAWREYQRRRVLGWGAGTFERHWVQRRPSASVARDAHSLYLESLMETGPIGLGLLSLALVVPLVMAQRARATALVPAALGAYVAFLAHTAIDWDWEQPAVTLTAIFCAAAILAAARTSGLPPVAPRLHAALLLGVLAIAAFSFVGLMGNRALAASRAAERDGNLVRAESEAKTARRWAPWSPEPWQALADVEFKRNDLAAARAALLEAVERDRGDWAYWYDLGVASSGASKQRAYEEAGRLNPRGANVEVLRILGVLPKLPVGKR